MVAEIGAASKRREEFDPKVPAGGSPLRLKRGLRPRTTNRFVDKPVDKTPSAIEFCGLPMPDSLYMI
jgi:hypothetical protein